MISMRTDFGRALMTPSMRRFVFGHALEMSLSIDQIQEEHPLRQALAREAEQMWKLLSDRKSPENP